MKTIEMISMDGHQALTLPDEFRFTDTTVIIRKDGDALILERVKANTWPTEFFEAIHIDDTAFIRPTQGAHHRLLPKIPESVHAIHLLQINCLRFRFRADQAMAGIAGGLPAHRQQLSFKPQSA